MEFWNFLTHCLGAAAALYILYKVIHIRIKEFVFAVCMCICLGFSSAYHFCLLIGNDDQFVRKLDHCGIFLLIAGTSTALFKNKLSIAILWSATFSFIMAIADAGTAFSVEKLTAAYLFMGWLCTMWAIWEHRWKWWNIASIGVGSGIMTLGSLINLYNYQFGHVIFHILTLVGSLFYVRLILK